MGEHRVRLTWEKGAARLLARHAHYGADRHELLAAAEDEAVLLRLP